MPHLMIAFPSDHHDLHTILAAIAPPLNDLCQHHGLTVETAFHDLKNPSRMELAELDDIVGGYIADADRYTAAEDPASGDDDVDRQAIGDLEEGFFDSSEDTPV